MELTPEVCTCRKPGVAVGKSFCYDLTPEFVDTCHVKIGFIKADLRINFDSWSSHQRFVRVASQALQSENPSAMIYHQNSWIHVMSKLGS